MNASELLTGLATDPLQFVALCWPDMCLYEKQSEILLSLRDNVETFVHAANETGKTRTAALAALWFFATRTPARVVTSSSSETQLNTILWGELRDLIRRSRIPFPFSIKSLRIEKLSGGQKDEVEAKDYILGHVTNVVENFQGHHLSNDRPRVLALFDEASAIGDEFNDAADSWAHRKLVIGNPLATDNFFYRLCQAGDQEDPAGRAPLLRKVIHISGEDSPNVRAGMSWVKNGKQGSCPVPLPGVVSYPDYLRRKHHWDEVKKTTRLYGHFYVGDQARLFPPEWLTAAMDAKRWEELAQQERRAEAMGVDVAAGGRDKSCWTLIDAHGIVRQEIRDLRDTMQIVARTIQLIDEYELPLGTVVFDAGGGGKQLVDRLHEQGYSVQMVGFGEAPESRSRQACKNRRAEMYSMLRELIDPSREGPVFALPPDAHQLHRELSILPLLYDSEGALFLPPKENRAGSTSTQPSIRSLLGYSPDRADSLVLAIWGITHPVQLWCDRPAAYYKGMDLETPPKRYRRIGDLLQDIIDFHRDRRKKEEQERLFDESDSPFSRSS